MLEVRTILPTTFVAAALSALTLGCGASAVDESAVAGAATADLEPSAARDPGADPFDPGEGILFWTPEQQLSGYRNTVEIFDTRTIHAGTDVYPLVSAPHDFSGLTYEVEGEPFTIDDYVRDKRVVGLLVSKGDRILLERYSLGNDESSRWISFSIAKSVTSMLIGAAIVDGLIESVDDPVTRYLPDLVGSSYDAVTIRDVLQMASGVDWNEDYADPTSDVATMPPGELALLEQMAGLGRVAEPGEEFNYNTGETNLAGSLARAAIGGNLSQYLERKIWQPFGMEADADWMLHEANGGELGGCCLSAVLRDYARLGLFAMQDGVLRDGTRVLPEGWMEESTTPSDAWEGYGYLWWLWGEGAYAGVGIFGQLLFIDPANEIVIVTHSAWPTAVGRELSAHRRAFVAALAEEALAVQ